MVSSVTNLLHWQKTSYASRRRKLITVCAYHLPPVALPILRRFNSAAACCADRPVSSCITGRMRSARPAASFWLRSEPAVQPPSFTPRALAAARPSLVRLLISVRSFCAGLDEMLTVIRLGLPDQLRRSLGCTNAIESLIAVLRQVCRNVKRWRDARMALRWTGTAMLEAAKSFRRLKAHKQLPVLRAALLRHQQALLGDQPIASKNLAA
jgi:hypothetical protein